ncbi:hypothetical protein MASSI9I_90043 [Massilia sp. 9I]|nr:hypothetical protein MASSI9I_90043 [Massilia sp. 9I]
MLTQRDYRDHKSPFQAGMWVSEPTFLRKHNPIGGLYTLARGIRNDSRAGYTGTAGRGRTDGNSCHGHGPGARLPSHGRAIRLTEKRTQSYSVE